jgi:hypothetical protein
MIQERHHLEMVEKISELHNVRGRNRDRLFLIGLVIFFWAYWVYFGDHEACWTHTCEVAKEQEARQKLADEVCVEMHGNGYYAVGVNEQNPGGTCQNDPPLLK